MQPCSQQHCRMHIMLHSNSWIQNRAILSTHFLFHAMLSYATRAWAGQARTHLPEAGETTISCAQPLFTPFVSEGASALFTALRRDQQRTPPHLLLLDPFSPQHSCSSLKSRSRGNGEEPHKSLRMSSRCLLQRNRNPFLKALSSLTIALPASGTHYPRFD